MKGMFIAIEGLRTNERLVQCTKMYKWLKGVKRDAVITSEPTEGKFGKILHEYIFDHKDYPLVEALLFALDRVEHLENIIKPALEKGAVVITDRYFYSSIAFQGAEGLDMQYIKSLNSFALKPDLAFFIDVDIQTIFEENLKKEKRTKFEKDTKLLHKIRNNYMELVKEREIIRLDGSRNSNEIFEEIKSIIEKKLNL